VFVAAEYLDDNICRWSFADAFPVTIGESRPSLLVISTTGDEEVVLLNFGVDKNSGDEIR